MSKASKQKNRLRPPASPSGSEEATPPLASAGSAPTAQRARPSKGLQPKAAPKTEAEMRLTGHLTPLVTGLLAFAFLLRLAYLLEFRTTPLFEGLVLDEANYSAWAKEIAAGDFWGKGVFTANPLGPYLLGIVYDLFGTSLWTARVVQALVDTASCYFIYRVTLHLFSKPAALAALLLSVFYGPMIFFAGNLVAEVWVVALVGASLMLLSHPTYRIWRRVLAGGLFALATLGRPNLVLIMPLLPFSMSLSWHGMPWKVRIQRSAFWFIGVALILTPVGVRNKLEGGTPSPLPAHGGVNLWIGNNPDADGFFKTPRGSRLAGGQKELVTSSIKVAQEALGHPVSPSEASGWWQARAMDWMKAHPGNAAKLMLRKTGLVVNAYEKPLESNYHYAKTYSLVLRFGVLGFGLMAPLALLGMLLSVRRWREIAPLYIFVLVYLASIVVTFVSMRYRLPLVPALFPFAGASVATLLETSKAGTKRAFLVPVSLLIPCVALVHLPLSGRDVDHDIAHTEYLLGNLASDGRQLDKAIAHYEKAISLYPEWGGYYNNLGLAYLKAQSPEKAVAALEKAVALDQEDRKVYRNLAKSYRALKQLDQAAEAYEHALTLSPGHVPTHLDLASVLAQLGRQEEAIKQYEWVLSNTNDTRRRKVADEGLRRLGATPSNAAARPEIEPPEEEASRDEGEIP